MNRRLMVPAGALALIAVPGCGSDDSTGGQEVRGVVSAQTSTGNCVGMRTAVGGTELTGAKVVAEGVDGQQASALLRFDSYAPSATSMSEYGFCAWTFDFTAPISPTYTVTVADLPARTGVPAALLGSTHNRFEVDLGTGDVVER